MYRPDDSTDNNVHVVWEPLEGSQSLALDSPAQQTLFTGTRGPGKTDCQLMRFRRNVGRGYGSFWRGIILDREYKNLDDLVTKSKRWFYQFEDGAEFLSSSSQYKWVWRTGEELLFRTAKKEEDYWDYHGQEFPFIGWNELTKYPTGRLYSMFMSCNRSSWTQAKDSPLTEDESDYLLPQIPLEVFSTTNPWGAGHAWVKQQFIDPAPYGQIVRNKIEVFDPQTQKQVEVERTQVAIFGSYKENKYLSKEYIATLESETDQNLRKAWLTGSWDIVAGGALSDLWEPSTHIRPRFKVPSNWYVDRSFDWGSSHPFWVGWWAEANGEEVTVVWPDGRKEKWCPPKKSIILIHEWYGTKRLGTNEGLRMSAKDIAKGIRAREDALRAEGWLNGPVYPGPADKQIWASPKPAEETIAKKMESPPLKVRWTKSDKSKGSRINGLQLFRDRLEAARDGAGPGFYVMVHCRAFIAIVPTLPRDPDNPDDVDTEAEDHPYDGSRYRVLAPMRRLARSISASFARAR